MTEAPYINNRGEWVDPSSPCETCDGKLGYPCGSHYTSCWECNRTGYLTIGVRDPRHPKYVPPPPRPKEPVPEWAASEIRNSWENAKGRGQTEAYRILERMVDRLGYGRLDNNPPIE